MLLLLLRRYETFGPPATAQTSPRTRVGGALGQTQAAITTGRTETATAIGRTSVSVGT